ncbi:hypothetical protein H2200_004926 [Cladophialophora chaetospira]|uniref:C3H1-type domain-containing protein n=1 Tax=Cladophialophora chaetospira TaxID=386627 RepID=A0AA38XE36_9EURO|nr:hypothetical protein H2200_004926 [Cladophialophora chaetospira]
MSRVPTCRSWLQGRCRKGPFCTFRHEATRVPKPSKSILADTGLLLETIRSQSPAEPSRSDQDISLTGYEFLSSYSWVDDDLPTIYVPGAPPVWKSKDPPFTIAKDEGTYLTDQNAARCAMYPTEPLFRSLAVMQPDLSMREFDIVTDSNCLRKLLRFVTLAVDRSFRIDVQVQGGVIFFGRWEPAIKHTILGQYHIGFGHNFRKAMTLFDDGLQDSSGHYRVVRYSIGGLRCLVRYEAGGCTGAGEAPTKRNISGDSGNTDDLPDTLNSMSIATPRTEAKDSVQVLNKGRVVPTSSIMEIKTRTARRKQKMDEVIPQLWFEQTPKIFVGYHVSGKFEEIQKILMKEEFQRWEESQQARLRQLVDLLKKLKEVVLRTKGQRCVVVCEMETNSTELRVYESTTKAAVLPDDIIKMHDWAEEVGAKEVTEVEIAPGEKS